MDSCKPSVSLDNAEVWQAMLAFFGILNTDSSDAPQTMDLTVSPRLMPSDAICTLTCTPNISQWHVGLVQAKVSTHLRQGPLESLDPHTPRGETKSSLTASQTSYLGCSFWNTACSGKCIEQLRLESHSETHVRRIFEAGLPLAWHARSGQNETGPRTTWCEASNNGGWRKDSL